MNARDADAGRVSEADAFFNPVLIYCGVGVGGGEEGLLGGGRRGERWLGCPQEGPQERKTVMEEWNKGKMKGRDVEEKGGCWPSVQW